MTKPETRQKMAEWLAENVLHNHFSRALIYSPYGFFAVWDAVEKMRHFVGMEMYIPPDEELQGDAYSCTIVKVTMEQIIGCGKDRYEAFYNAVFEAMDNGMRSNNERT